MAQNWKLVWEDEFNGSGVPDPAKWGYDTGNGGWGNYELQNYTANRTENARQENGTLVLEARRDWYNGIEYSSARLVSKNKGDWKYGRIEVKAKIPLGQGLWPAIWMLPTDWVYGGWPASGEIDIMENFALGGIKPNHIEGNVHTQAYHHSIGTNKGGTSAYLSNIQDNYHVYAVNWFENKIEFEVDGIVYFTFNNEGTWQTWPFDQRFHLILNLAVGGSLGTTPDPTIFPKRMTVDYVKVFELDNGPSASTGIVTTFQHCPYDGFSGGFSVGNYTKADLENLGVEDNSISSIQVAEGFKATLYDGDNFTGNSKEITASSTCINDFNDKTTSLKVEPNGNENITGIYYLTNRVTGKLLDVAGGETATDNGDNLHQWDRTNTSNQQFQFEHLGNGVYKVLAMNSEKSLDVAGISLNDGASILQWEYVGGANQQFIVVDAGNGYYKLIAKHSGKVLCIETTSNANGVDVQQKDNSNQTHSHWLFEPLNATAMENIQMSSISIYPNPAQEFLTVAGNEKSSQKNYFISNLLGEVIQTGTAENNIIHVANLSNGVYFITFSYGQKIRFIKR